MLNIDVPLIVPQTPIPFAIVPRGLQEGEVALPEEEDAVADTSALPPLHESSYAELLEMGFPANRAEKALRATGNANADTAMQWLFAHMDDPDIDDPYIPTIDVAVNNQNIADLTAMGFDEQMVKTALQETVSSPPLALYFTSLFFMC